MANDRWGEALPLALVAAAAVVLAAAAARLVSAGGQAGEPLSFPTVAPGVEVSGELRPRPWGTEVQLAVRGASAGVVHVVRVRDRGGQLSPAGTFTGAGEASVTPSLTTAVPAGQLVGVVVTDPGGEVVLAAER